MIRSNNHWQWLLRTLFLNTIPSKSNVFALIFVEYILLYSLLFILFFSMYFGHLPRLLAMTTFLYFSLTGLAMSFMTYQNPIALHVSKLGSKLAISVASVFIFQ